MKTSLCNQFQLSECIRVQSTVSCNAACCELVVCQQEDQQASKSGSEEEIHIRATYSSPSFELLADYQEDHLENSQNDQLHLAPQDI